MLLLSTFYGWRTSLERLGNLPRVTRLGKKRSQGLNPGLIPKSASCQRYNWGTWKLVVVGPYRAGGGCLEESSSWSAGAGSWTVAAWWLFSCRQWGTSKSLKYVLIMSFSKFPGYFRKYKQFEECPQGGRRCNGRDDLVLENQRVKLGSIFFSSWGLYSALWEALRSISNLKNWDLPLFILTLFLPPRLRFSFPFPLCCISLVYFLLWSRKTGF